MPRQKLSEYRAKQIVSGALEQDYVGWSVVGSKLPSGITGSKFVVKVDQAIKQRFKRGLVYLDVSKKDLPGKVHELSDKGYTSAIIEPYVTHDSSAERYLSFRRERDGVVFSYSHLGGIDIEANADSITSGYFDKLPLATLSKKTKLSQQQLLALRKVFDDQYMSLLEINPYISEGDGLKILDAAIEVDSTAELLVDGWNDDDIRTPQSSTTDEEVAVRKLNGESPASFSLEMIDPDGSIFLLLSGGGASVVVADEIFTAGKGKQLANYGEYSGNPNEYETAFYAEQVVKLLLRSKAKHKVVFIGGAVANFTDIKSTFAGIISMLRTYDTSLRRQKVKFYVRRGGPRQVEGLQAIKKVFDELGLYSEVYDPSTTIPTAVASVLKGLK